MLLPVVICLTFSQLLGRCGAQLCSWVEPVSQWTTGQRLLLKLNVEKYSTYWNVTFQFDQEVIFEAWKGDITELTTTTFSLTNKCYNGILYPCQCLELGYLIRHQAGEDPQAMYFLNGELAPACSEEPPCTGATTADPSTTTGATADIENDPPIHRCESSPCHPDAICDPLEGFSNYTCICPVASNETGVDLYDSSSTDTGCTVPGK